MFNLGDLERAKEIQDRLMIMEPDNVQVRNDRATLLKLLAEQQKSTEKHDVVVEANTDSKKKVSFAEELTEVKSFHKESIISENEETKTEKMSSSEVTAPSALKMSSPEVIAPSELKMPELPKGSEIRRAHIPNSVIQGAIAKAAKIVEDEIPKTSYSFLAQAGAMKNAPEQFLRFIQLLPIDALCSLFSEVQISYDLLDQILEALKTCEDQGYVTELLEKLPRTKSFNLTVMFLTRGHKNDIKGMIGDKTELLATYKIK